MAAPILERCSSGLRGTPGKRVYFKRVSGVRISFSPQQNEAQRNALGFFVQGRQELRLLRGLGRKNPKVVDRELHSVARASAASSWRKDARSAANLVCNYRPAQRNALGFFVQGRQELRLLRGLGKEMVFLFFVAYFVVFLKSSGTNSER